VSKPNIGIVWIVLRVTHNTGVDTEAVDGGWWVRHNMEWLSNILNSLIFYALQVYICKWVYIK
jgi:hypothetical protein